ncbi:hypothetical protein [Pseudonocardia sp.]|jgi:hypothetical protein|uniref:hypothetical protein n=1 Tax=Pseudonocardia sp. TaxID=60912 RepID=UPI0031FDEFF0
MDDSANLPLPDYDHLPVGSLQHRIRTLDADGVTALLDYEQAHGRRFNVVQLLTQRLDALRSGDARPSGGDPAAPQPEQAPAPAGGSPGNAAATPDNNQPLRHGVAGQTPNRDIRAR